MRSLREGLDEMLPATIELLGADMGNVQLLDPDRGVLVIAAHKGFEQDFLDFFREVSTEDDSACARALRSGERIVIEDVAVDAPYAPLRPIARSAGYRGVQSTPLIGRDGCPLGMLSTHFGAAHRPSEQELGYLDLYARQATDFIERWRSDEALRQSEEALRASAERLRGLTETAVDGIITIDERGLIELLNPAAVKLFGYQPHEVIGRNVRMLMPEPYRSEHDGYLENYLRTGEKKIIGIGREVTGLRADGSTFPMELSVSETTLADGRPSFAGIVRDITDRKRAEEALRESEERFARFMQQLPGLAWIKDVEGRYVYANDAAEKAFQTPREKLYGRTDYGIFPAEVAARFAENDRRALASEAGVQVIETLEHEDGVVHHSIVSKFPIQGPDGRPILIGGMAIDITERKQAEESLRESEERFRNMANNAPLMIWVSEPDASCSFLSKSWYEFTGQKPERALGFGWLDAIHPDDRVKMYGTSPGVNERREPFRTEYRVRQHDGEYRWMLNSAAPRFGTGGEFLGYIGSITDITDRREMEQELRRANAAKDEFLGLVSHELRTPITTILGMSQVLRTRGESLSSEDRKSSLDDIANDAQRLDRIVRNLLILARLEEGHGLELEPLLLGKILSRLVEEHKRHSRREVTLQIGDVAAVTGHTDYLDQIVRNLLSNAEKYGGNGAIEIAVSQELEFAVVSVSDRGRGIPDQEREAIFAPFFRSESTQTFQGIGIGLAVCRRLAEAMGGRIWVEPRKGGGSTFAFTLPIYRDESS